MAQVAERSHLSQLNGLEQLCAVVNNNVLCYDQFTDLVDRLGEVMRDQYKEQINVAEACQVSENVTNIVF